jgi:hypothetical protein
MEIGARRNALRQLLSQIQKYFFGFAVLLLYVVSPTACFTGIDVVWPNETHTSHRRHTSTESTMVIVSPELAASYGLVVNQNKELFRGGHSYPMGKKLEVAMVYKQHGEANPGEQCRVSPKFVDKIVDELLTMIYIGTAKKSSRFSPTVRAPFRINGHLFCLVEGVTHSH